MTHTNVLIGQSWCETCVSGWWWWWSTTYPLMPVSTCSCWLETGLLLSWLDTSSTCCPMRWSWDWCRPQCQWKLHCIHQRPHRGRDKNEHHSYQQVVDKRYLAGVSGDESTLSAQGHKLEQFLVTFVVLQRLSSKSWLSKDTHDTQVIHILPISYQ